MRRVTGAALFAFAVRAVAANSAANSPEDYAYVFPIETPAHDANAASSAWRIELTPDVYHWAQDADLRDIEIFNAEQHPVPFARIAVEPTSTTAEQSTSLPVLELPASAKNVPGDLRLIIDRDAAGRLRRIDAGEKSSASTTSGDWLLDASGLDRAIDRVVLSWREPTSGIVARFAIDASDDLQDWRSAGTATVLALEQQGARLERREIPLGGVRAKYLRLRRLDDGSAIVGLRADAHSVERTRALPERVWIDAETKPVSADEPAARGIAHFDYVLAAALPVDIARIELASDNALAPVSLFARTADAVSMPWIRLGNVTAFRLRQGGETLRNDDIDIRATQRLRIFRIESSTALAEPPHLALGYRPDSLVFLAEGNGPYLLAAGSAQARHADYPIEPALASLRASLGKDWQPPVAKIGIARTSAGDNALRIPTPPVPWRRWLLWAILVGGALLIAGLGLSLLRGSKPPE
jgi:hypothetical protein